MDDLMTSAEVAKLLRVHKMSLYRWIKTSAFPAHRIGGRWRFSRSEILGWVKSFHAQPADAPHTNQTPASVTQETIDP